MVVRKESRDLSGGRVVWKLRFRKDALLFSRSVVKGFLRFFRIFLFGFLRKFQLKSFKKTSFFEFFVIFSKNRFFAIF